MSDFTAIRNALREHYPNVDKATDEQLPEMISKIIGEHRVLSEKVDAATWDYGRSRMDSLWEFRRLQKG